MSESTEQIQAEHLKREAARVADELLSHARETARQMLLLANKDALQMNTMLQNLVQKMSDVHTAVCGDEYDLKKPGLLRTTQKHSVTLYGESGKNGLNGDNQKYKRMFWIGTGAVGLAQILFAWYIAVHSH